MQYITVFKDFAKFSSFPSIVKLPNGQILIAFRQAGLFSVEAAKRDEPTHHDTESCICIISSYDNGLSYDLSTLQVVSKFDSGVNDPGLTLLSDGRLLLRNTLVQVCSSTERDSLKGSVSAHRPDLGTISTVLGLSVQFSEDYGITWSHPVIIKVNGSDEAFASREQAIELEDGTILISAYTGIANKTDNAYIIRSWDSGSTWRDATLLASDENGRKSVFQGISFNETSILNLGKGKIIALIRADSDYHTDDKYMAIGGIGQLFSSFSYNAGFSWTSPKPTGIFGQPAHLLKLSNGLILCTYGFRKSPFGIKAVVSDDNGMTWLIDKTIIIKEKCLFWDMGYPVSCQRDDGKIITVYYWVDENRTRYIESAIWELEL